MPDIELVASAPLKVGLCHLPTLSLTQTFTVFTADLRFIPEAAQLYMRLVNADDCRRNVRFEVRLGVWVGSVLGRVMAAWESFLLELPADTPRALVEIQIRVFDEDCELEQSLRSADPLPSLVLQSHEGAPCSAVVWISTVLPPRARALQFLSSTASYDYLGWMIGCTTTALALLDVAALEVRLSGVGEGLPLIGGTAFQLAPADEGNIAQLESFAPFAALATLPAASRGQLEQTAPQLLALCQAELPQYTSEGCFTIAYPLVCLADRLEQPAWFAAAQVAVLRRWEVLVRGSEIAQRGRADGSQVWMENWARGTAWLLLGTALVADKLPEQQRRVLIKKLVSVIPTLLERQLGNGLWSVFTHRADTGAESSGSAGIAAALAIAAKRKWLTADLEQRALTAAQACAAALDGCVEADGCLGLVSQHNPAAEQALQIGYRMRAAWGTGLYAILLWALATN